MNKSEVIRWAEQKLAREVALGVLTTQPLQHWLYLIPGMFIVDFWRRNRAIRLFSKRFLFPRDIALPLADNCLGQQNQNNQIGFIHEQVIHHLDRINLADADLASAYSELIDFLTIHYRDLLKTQGSSYNAMVAQTYTIADIYQRHLSPLGKLERTVDQALLDSAGVPETLQPQLTAEQKQIEVRRRRLVEEIFH